MSVFHIFTVIQFILAISPCFFRYTRSDPVSSHVGLWISSLDAGMACPMLNKAASSMLTSETAMQQSCFEYDIPVLTNMTKVMNQQQVEDSMIEGIGINLHNNRQGISGFPEWYPFGVGKRYQKQDETAQFRFVIEERLGHLADSTALFV